MITATGLIDTAPVNEVELVGEVKKMLGLSARIVAEGVRRAIEFSGTGTYAPYVRKKRLAYEKSVMGEALKNWMHDEQEIFPPDPNLRVVQVGWTKEYLQKDHGKIKRWRQVEGGAHPARKCAFSEREIAELFKNSKAYLNVPFSVRTKVEVTKDLLWEFKCPCFKNPRINECANPIKSNRVFADALANLLSSEC
ncbi:hypothetical protein ScalyP_jg1611 [Parmales sp. scaly parma]|nr:hypothetical protein ScalyP_jg1611 [Parmales sp. scaly parma]